MSADGQHEAVFRELARTGEVPPQGRLVRRAEGVSVLIVRTEAGYHAVENRCSHATSALDAGRLEGGVIECPLHGARFDVRDGRCLGGPASRPLTTFDVRVRGDRIEVALPADAARPAAPRFGPLN